MCALLQTLVVDVKRYTGLGQVFASLLPAQLIGIQLSVVPRWALVEGTNDIRTQTLSTVAILILTYASGHVTSYISSAVRLKSNSVPIG